jgi:hypothetical protein
VAAEEKYPSKGLNLEIGIVEVKPTQTRPPRINALVCVIFRQFGPFSATFRAQTLAVLVT